MERTNLQVLRADKVPIRGPTSIDLEMSKLFLGGEVGDKGSPEMVDLGPHSRLDRVGHVPMISLLHETLPHYLLALLSRKNG